ncbi:MAG: saccharopine dehydrogenase NADP-binding domain-containing protein [Burkholderiales bacterium]|jgi:saccharopine dehydrogenase (NAD+, L-lysine-forming)|nr:saccharopine dehydrogenase NADP-binding domain-containing protein [Burkholderiales bacterium]
MPPILIYGATGFTGRAIVKALRALDPPVPFVCSGRDATELARLQARLDTDSKSDAPRPLLWRVASLDDRNALDRALDGVAVVINAAGPFERTAVPLARACARTKAAYLDTSGEYADFAVLRDLRRSDAATRAIPILCGVGFTPVFATEMARLMQQAFAECGSKGKTVRVAMAMPTRSSRGSARSALRAAANAFVVRGTVATAVPSGSLERSFPVSGHERRAAVCGILTLAELDQIGRGLGIENVECYFEMHALTRTVMAGAGLLHTLDRFVPWTVPVDRAMRWLPEVFDMRVDRHLEDPPKLVCVEMEDDLQRRATMILEGGDHYDSTAELATAVAVDLLQYRATSGSWTGMCNEDGVGWASLVRDGQHPAGDVLYKHLGRTRGFFATRRLHAHTASHEGLRKVLASVLDRWNVFGAAPVLA